MLSFEKGIKKLYNANQSDDVTVSTLKIKGTQALQIDFGSTEYPKADFQFPEALDFTGKSQRLNIQNPTDITLSFRISLKSTTGEQVFQLSVAPGDSFTPYLSLGAGEDLGMRVSPFAKFTPYYGDNGFSKSTVTGFSIWLCQLYSPATLIIGDLAILSDGDNNIKITELVDRYGQIINNHWDSKISRDQELVDNKKIEAGRLSLPGTIKDRSQYGGWSAKGGFAYTETTFGKEGFFQTYRDPANGKWWLVDPEGYLYLSTGLDIIRLGDMNTIIEGREEIFASFSPEDIPSSPGNHWSYVHYNHKGESGWAYNFYSANLQKKYGADWLNQWRDISLKRMATWGFTSLGNWSDPDLFYGQGSTNKVPYTAHVWIDKGHDRLSSGSDYWWPTHDPYDPQFKTNVRTQAELVASQVKDDPWCMGIFVDNEISWGTTLDDKTHFGIILSAFAVDVNEKAEGHNAKSALIELLKTRYSGEIASLNAAWGSNFSSWLELNRSYDLTIHLDGKNHFKQSLKSDMSVLLEEYASQYYRTVNEVVKDASIFPNHLYLGSRMFSNGTPREILYAAGNYCDVISLNHYSQDINTNFLEPGLLEAVDKPCIIGEFHIGMQGENHWWAGLVSASDRIEQGQMYHRYMKSIYDNKYFVGAHWFQYVDQPNTGRSWDGENGNIGFVSVTDDPYDDFIEGVKSSNWEMYKQRER